METREGTMKNIFEEKGQETWVESQIRLIITKEILGEDFYLHFLWKSSRTNKVSAVLNAYTFYKSADKFMPRKQN